MAYKSHACRFDHSLKIPKCNIIIILFVEFTYNLFFTQRALLVEYVKLMAFFLCKGEVIATKKSEKPVYKTW